MLFAYIMSKRNFYFISVFTAVILLVGILFGFKAPQDDFTSQVKVSLRSVGHQLLMERQDSTSIVLPILKMSDGKFQLSFEKELSIEPRKLVSIVKNTIEKESFPTQYLVEVKQCSSQEVAYSYEIKQSVEKDIIACLGRVLKEDCYVIEFTFKKVKSSFIDSKVVLIVLLLMVFIFVTLFYYQRKSKILTKGNEGDYESIGCFQFYPDQNKLVKEAVEINLSKKECELLAIFIANPNQIIKRDELTKRVWEDHGVIVGRSLDTYISKLRKKLKDDTSIKLTNVHGVGYKLEIRE